MAPAFLCALVEAGLDIAGALDGRRRDLDGLGVVKGRLPGLGQRPRVALGAGARGPAVTLVADDVAGGGGCQRRGAVGAGQREHTARERLLEDGVAAVLGFDIVHLCLQGLAVPDHGSDAQPAELSGVVDGRVHIENAAGVLVDDVADDIELELRLANLRRGDHDDLVHLRIREGPHGLLEVRGALGAPRACLGRAFGGEAAVLVGPLVHGQALRRGEAFDRPRDGGVELRGGLLSRPRHRRARSIPPDPLPAAHRPRDRICSRPAPRGSCRPRRG